MFPGRAHLGTWRDDFRSKIQVVFRTVENDGKFSSKRGKWWNILINRRLKSALEGSSEPKNPQATTLLEIFWTHMSPWPQNPSTQTGVFPPIDHFYCYYGDTTETMHDSHWMPSVSLKFCDHVPMEHMPIHSTSSIHEYIHEYWWTYPQFLSPHLQTAIDQLFDCYPPGHPHGLWDDDQISYDHITGWSSIIVIINYMIIMGWLKRYICHDKSWN